MDSPIQEQALRQQSPRGQEELDVPQIALDRARDIGELDFYGDTCRLAGGRRRRSEDGRVHLPNRGCRERESVK